MEELAQCRARALNLLVRREHTERELYSKLLAKKFTQDIILHVIEKLIAEGLLSDARFTELYVEQRARRGYGSMRIRQELQQRGVTTELIEQALADHQNEWRENARQAWQKYMRLHPGADSIKQQKFLLYRGYDYEQFKDLINYEHQ